MYFLITKSIRSASEDGISTPDFSSGIASSKNIFSTRIALFLNIEPPVINLK